MTLSEIKKKLSAIKELGYVQTLRKGPTGIGYTLETLLEIKENNISSPDLGEIELKAQRERHSGMTTLFTFDRKAWKMNPLAAVRAYGSVDPHGRLGMYYTMSKKPNSAGLFLTVDDEAVAVQHTHGNVIAVWPLSEIEKRFEQKVKNVLLVKAKTEEREENEYFLFDRARLLSHGTSKALLRNHFENETLLLDLRLHDQGSRARNHGTAFRVFENNLETLYEKVDEITF